MLMSWLGVHVKSLHNKINRLEQTKVDKEVYNELKSDIHKILEELIALKLEQARWQGRMEQKTPQDSSRRERS